MSPSRLLAHLHVRIASDKAKAPASPMVQLPLSDSVVSGAAGSAARSRPAVPCTRQVASACAPALVTWL